MNHPDHDFSNHHYQQNYTSTRLSTSTVSKRPTTNTQIQNSDSRFHKAPKPFVESDRHNTRNPGSTRTLDLTMKLLDAEYSSNASGNLSSQRLSGLAPNSELTENGRASGNKIFSGLSEKRRSFDSMEECTSRDSSEYHHVRGDMIFSGLTEKYRVSKRSPENLHDLAGTRISDLTGKHRHSCGGGCSCSSGMMSTSCKLGPPPASKLAVPHKSEEAEENAKLFSGQILNPYACEHTKPKPNCEKPNLYHKPINNPIKPKPTLPQNQPITLSNVMQFMAEWFEFEEEKIVVEDTLMVTKLSPSRASLESINDEFTEEECDGQVFATHIKAVQPNVIFEEQDLCNLGVKHTLGFVGNTIEEKSVFVAMDFNNDDESISFGHEATVEIVPISSIEQGLCLVDQGSAKDNFNKCDIVTEALELIPTYVEHITIPHTNLEEFMVKSQELTCESVDLSLDNILKPYKVDLQQQDFKQQVQVFLGRTSYEFTKGCSMSNGQNQCNLCKELVITWKVSLLPLWIWDELRRDFSVGVYHSYKMNRIALLVNFSELPSFLISGSCVTCYITFISTYFNRTRG